jgi:putative transposase
MNTQPQVKQLGFWESTLNPSEDGKKKEKSRRSGLQEVKDVSKGKKSKISQENSDQLSLFAMQGSALVPNEMILSDKLNIFAKDTQRLSTFQKLDQDSILRGKNCAPFWNELCSTIFNGLSLPTLIGCADSDLNWLGGYAKQINANSWFSITASSAPILSLWQICCPSSTASVHGFTGLENIEKKSDKSYGKNPYKKSQNKPPNSLVKIPIFPCQELHQIWKQWLAAYRWVYNQCIEFFNSGIVLPKGTSLDQYIQALQKKPEYEWTQCLGKTRQEAVCEAENAKRQALKMWKAKPKTERRKFEMRFRSCQNKSQVIQFKNDAYKNGTWFPTKVKGLLYCTAIGYEVPQNCDYGTELVYQRGQWFACFPKYEEVKATGSDKVIFLDPGVRTMLTGYDSENILEIGKGDIGRIIRLCLHLDKVISQKVRASGKSNKRKRYKLNQSIARLHIRIRCLVDDLHHKAASLLVNSYKLIFLPTYETSQMVLKATRKINRKSVRSMLTWAMGRFSQHLEQAASRNGVLVVRINESFTSKTCPRCGKIHHKLGGQKTFICPNCGFTNPRDWVGAVNIMLAALQAVAFNVNGTQLSIDTLTSDVIVAQSRERCEA